MSEADYERGARAVWLHLLTEAIANLGYNTPEANKAAWIVERERTIAVLRDVCDHCGDNDWPDNLSLGDVVDKHLYRHLDHAITTLEKLASLYRREAIWKGEQESVIADAPHTCGALGSRLGSSWIFLHCERRGARCKAEGREGSGTV